MTSVMLFVAFFCISTLQSTQFIRLLYSGSGGRMAVSEIQGSHFDDLFLFNNSHFYRKNSNFKTKYFDTMIVEPIQPVTEGSPN